MSTAAPTIASDGKIECKIDGARVHSVQLHLRDNHPSISIEDYRARFPDAPILSPTALSKIAARKAPAPVAATAAVVKGAVEKQAFHQVFELGTAKAAMAASGGPIMIDVFGDLDEQSAALVPSVDPNYVFNIDLTKVAIIALQLGIPAYFWGFHGTGKTSVWKQVHARTRRPFLRVQHTVNMEEADVLGQWTVRAGETVFQPGPLAMAMMKGWTYCADEYDFAPPTATAVYQPVLEGEPLVIKNAPPEFQVIKPHPNFRFIATGNTNGVGDETGLYQGTQLGNAANYSRFGITEEVGYMSSNVEAIIVANQSTCSREDADKVVDFANKVREQYKGGKISSTVSPRELIYGARLGLARQNFREGLKLAFTNRLSRVDKVAVDELAQRIWG